MWADSAVISEIQGMDTMTATPGQMNNLKYKCLKTDTFRKLILFNIVQICVSLLFYNQEKCVVLVLYDIVFTYCIYCLIAYLFFI